MASMHPVSCTCQSCSVQLAVPPPHVRQATVPASFMTTSGNGSMQGLALVPRRQRVKEATRRAFSEYLGLLLLPLLLLLLLRRNITHVCTAASTQLLVCRPRLHTKACQGRA